MAIQYSIQKMVSDGTLSTIALGIQYLQRNDIYMRVAGDETPQSGAPSGYTWSFVNNTTLKILPVVPNGVEVVVYRRTDVDAMYNIYSQNAQFDEATIDENNQQLLYIAQEYLEQGLPGTGIESLEYINTVAGVNYYRFKLTDGSYTPIFGVPDGTIILRSELSAPNGSDIVGFEQAGAGSVARTSQDKMRELITPQDFGAVGDGVINDDDAFAKLEAEFSDEVVNLLGLTYLVNAAPEGNIYTNGYFKRVSDGYLFEVRPADYVKVGNRNVIIGKDAGSNMPEWVQYRGPQLAYGVHAIGQEALYNNKNGRNLTAIGARAMYSLVNGRYNVAVGLESQYCVNSDDGAYFTGTRNTSIGDNSLRFNVTGRGNQAMGRNAAQCLTNGDNNVAIGAGSMGGDAPLAIDDTTIVNDTPLTAGNITAVGVEAGRWANGGGTVAVGYRAAYNIKKGQVTVIGERAAENIESDSSYDGFALTIATKSGTYVLSGTSLVVTIPAHGFLAGYRIYCKIGTHELGWHSITSVTTDTVTLANTFSGNETGGVNISQWASTTPITPVVDVVAVGRQAAQNGKLCSNGTFVGVLAGQSVGGSNNTAIGFLAMFTNNVGVNNTAVGASALRTGATGSGNSVLGNFAANNITGDNNTAIGSSALRNMQDGSPATAVTNSSCLGSGTKVSGNNQVQLGDSATTTYVYGTVQNRSDLRDKADVRDTALGIEFIMGLRPVDGRWDMRDDYVVVDEEGNATHLEKDGSKKRARFHHWFIAQEVKELCDSLGVEFGGYQDHSVSGGCDVLSLGYDEFVPPTVKAVQQCWTRLDELEKRIEKLEI